jgi:hypothetical protein
MHLEPAALLGGRRVDPGPGHASQPLGALLLAAEVGDLVAQGEALFDEREEDLVLLLPAVEEGADVSPAR